MNPCAIPAGSAQGILAVQIRLRNPDVRTPQVQQTEWSEPLCVIPAGSFWSIWAVWIRAGKAASSHQRPCNPC